jgi:hypothetical protein
MEEWKEINFLPNLEVSSKGNIRNKTNKTLKKLSKAGKGYPTIKVRVKGKITSYYIHRLVAEFFIPNPLNLPQVDHIDNNKENNCVSNLQWITNRDNARKQINKPVIGLNLETEEILYFECCKDAGLFVQRSGRAISQSAEKGTIVNKKWKFNYAKINP